MFDCQRVLLTIVACMSATLVSIRAIGVRRQVLRKIQRSIENGKSSRTQFCCLRAARDSLSARQSHKFQVAAHRCIRGRMKNLCFVLAFIFAVIGGAAAAPSDGAWEVRFAGAVKCPSDWIVRLTIDQGRLSGVFQALIRWGSRWGLAPQAIENFVLKPDGSFTGTTSGFAPGRQGAIPALKMFSVSGQFSGDTVTVTTTRIDGGCETRTGQGTRSGA
jgi:hypothetical protein